MAKFEKGNKDGQKFKEGNPGGPGRPPGPSRKTILNEWLNHPAKLADPLTGAELTGTEYDAVCIALIKKAKKGDPRAFAELMDRADGRPTTKIEIDEVPTFKVIFDGDTNKGNDDTKKKPRRPRKSSTK